MATVVVLKPFEKSLKRLLKKYPSLQFEFLHLVESLEENPTLGIFLGDNCYKIRLSIASKGKGKSGGARVITYVKITKETVYLLTMYDKADRADISAAELKAILKEANLPDDSE